jgi:hypothetical protein
MVLESQFSVPNNHVAKINPNSKVYKWIEMRATKFILFSTFLETTQMKLLLYKLHSILFTFYTWKHCYEFWFERNSEKGWLVYEVNSSVF